MYFLLPFADYTLIFMPKKPFLMSTKPLSLLLICIAASITVQAQRLVHHTTNWFGPNANPIPVFTDASIPSETRLSLMGDYYFGHGDQTKAGYLQLEVPIIKKRVSIKAWGSFEFFEVTDDVKDVRNMQKNKGSAFGDVYVQSRFLLLRERSLAPAVLLNITLKTASGSQFRNRRYFNTAGYYFDAEIGKTYALNSSLISAIRWVGNLGFFSWDVQTPNLNVQDDALMYGGKLILKNDFVTWENTIAGYSGWINRAENYGNKPLSFTSKIQVDLQSTLLSLQYQHGVRHFPYDQIRIGVDVPVLLLTPAYKGD